MGITGSDEYGILLILMEDSMDTKMDLDPCGGSISTSNNE